MMRFVPVLLAFLDIGAIAALYIAAAIFAPSRPYGLLYLVSTTPHSGGARRPTMAHRAQKAVMVRRVPVSGIGPTASRSRASNGSASSQGEADREGACKSMNRAQEEKHHLALANRQIAELTVQIVRQRVIVKHALDTGQRSEMAESLLDALEGSLRIFEKHRIFLLSCSVNGYAGHPAPRPVAPAARR
jgi:hypothetical protein